MDGKDDAAEEESPLELHNQAVAMQIYQRLQIGLQACLSVTEHYVIRHGETGVLSVVASASTPEGPAVVHGPADFPACLAYVNSTVVTHLAEAKPMHLETPTSAPPQIEDRGVTT